MKQDFICIQCNGEYPEGLDVEGDMYLDTRVNEQFGGKRCVFCYNDNHPFYPLDIEQCYHHASNLERYGVAITDNELGKTWKEIRG